MLGLHVNRNLYLAHYDTGGFRYSMIVDDEGQLFVVSLNLPRSLPFREVQSGIVGVCDGINSVGTTAAHTFGQAFSQAPTVLVTPGEYDDAGCTQVRLSNVTATPSTTPSFALDATASYACLHWMAVVR